VIAAVSIRSLRVADISVLTGVLRRAYASEQNFELRLHSYLRMRAVATFVADLDGLPVGMVVGNDYGPRAYVSQMAVDPSVQRRGIGARLMDALTAWADARAFAASELDATPAGAPLYARYGFVAADRTDVYAAAGAALRPSFARKYVPADRPGIMAADAQAFGGDRSEVLGLLIDYAPGAVVVHGDGGRLQGYAIAQPRPQLLGPVVARNARDAAVLVDAARGLMPSEHRISVPSANRAVAALLTERGYRPLRSLDHMVRGTPPGGDRQRLFARINLGQG
jgi:GNAT superfamily N-acetyltransferase